MKTRISKRKRRGSIRAIASTGLLMLMIIISSCSSQQEADSASDTADAQAVSQGEEFVIDIDEVDENFHFYPVNVDGTDMEIIAVKDSDGNIRTAFNTCQVCYNSGRGYYQQDGDELVCQNCGNRFTAEQMGEEAGGCNPYPILSSDKTVDESSIGISYDFLRESADIFSNWKTAY